MRTVAVLLAAGRGQRLGAGRPKAFVELAGMTLLARAVATVEECPEVDGFVVVAPEGSEERASEAMGRSEKGVPVVVGGPSRQSSVAAALTALPERADVIVCHDVARPLASPKLFSAVVAAVDRADGAIPVLPVTDTLKQVQGDEVTETVDRTDLVAVQTPQAFRREALMAAHRHADTVASAGPATDDAALLEAAGF
ncbi:MAG TPA: 2-C-methyl-D-erythritol 4-phosphate cytidylyltransferase, partial [Actinomycetota bacterium]|nr:2-C-methyl-D-erythritol 4-phosphate cytidylyltransferase [Actinomycetota bacterium]